MKDRKTKKVLILALILVLICWLSAASMLIIIQKSKSVLTETANFVFELQSKKESIEILTKELDDVREESEILTNLIIGKNQEDVATFIGKIEETARASNVDIAIEKINIVEYQEKERGFEKIEVGFDTAGSWRQTFNFINLVENLPHQIEIMELSLNSNSPDDTGSTKWRAHFFLKALKFK